jgi:hypothetical protein
LDLRAKGLSVRATFDDAQSGQMPGVHNAHELSFDRAAVSASDEEQAVPK